MEKVDLARKQFLGGLATSASSIRAVSRIESGLERRCKFVMKS